jgi:hypothetical protein
MEDTVARGWADGTGSIGRDGGGGGVRAGGAGLNGRAGGGGSGKRGARGHTWLGWSIGPLGPGPSP